MVARTVRSRTGFEIMDTSDQQALTLLRDSLSEAQTNVRAYDTKAQIVGVGYIFALGIVAGVAEPLDTRVEGDVTYVLAAWGIGILPILLFGMVLHPSRKTAPHLTQTQVAGLQQILYVQPERHRSVDDLVDAARGSDPIKEISDELLKVSYLRELKRKRFLRALFSSGISFLVIFASHLTSVLGLL